VETDEEIPAALREFILRYIDSVAHLEALLLLRADPARRWTAEDLAARLYIPRDQAATVLGGLRDHGFIEVTDDTLRLAPADAERQRLLDELAQFYATHIIPVTQLIHSKPRRIREFADAFRLKKDR
jgi:hypothetical protein